MRSGEQRGTVFHLRPLRTDELLAKQPRAANAIPPAQRSPTGPKTPAPRKSPRHGSLDYTASTYQLRRDDLLSFDDKRLARLDTGPAQRGMHDGRHAAAIARVRAPKS